MGNKVKLKIVYKKDYNELIVFLTNFENEYRTSQFWTARILRWWDNNPAFSEDIVRGWILIRSDNKKIVGFLGNIPTFIQIRGKKTISFNATSWRVEKKHRNQSLYLIFAAKQYQKEKLHFDTTPSNRVVSILKSILYQQFPEKSRWMYYIPINPLNIIKTKLRINSFFSKIIKYPFVIIKLLLNIWFLRIQGMDRIKKIKDFNSQFDMLWQETKTKYLNTNIRTSEIIKWYCFDIENNNKVVVGYYIKNKLYAYSIFNLVHNDKLRQLICADIWGLEINEKVISCFCKYITQYAIDNDIDIIKYPEFNSAIGNIYKTIGLFRKKMIDNRFFQINKKQLENLSISDTYFTYMQGDFGL